MPQRPPPVLVVDDTPEIRRLLSQLLERSGFGAHLARDGQEALERVRAGAVPVAVEANLRGPGGVPSRFVASNPLIPGRLMSISTTTSASGADSTSCS